MSEEKLIHIIEFSDKQTDWHSQSEKYLARADYKGYSKLLLCEKNNKTSDVVPEISEVQALKAKDTPTDDDKKILQLAKLNKQGFMELMLSQNTTTTKCKIAFRLVRNFITHKFWHRNVQMAFD